MFCGSELQSSRGMARPCKIAHANMLVRGADAVDIKKPGREQRARSRFCRGGPCAEQFNVKPTFFTHFAQRRLLRIFVKLDMPAERQPLAQGPMMDEQDFCLLDYKDCHSEIDLVVNMRHRVSPCAPRGVCTIVNRLKTSVRPSGPQGGAAPPSAAAGSRRCWAGRGWTVSRPGSQQTTGPVSQ